MKLDSFIDKVFNKCTELNLTEFEIYFVSSSNQNIKVFKNNLDSYSDNQNQGISLRVKFKNKMGYSYTESLEDEDVELLINSAIESAKIIETDDEIEIYEKKEEYVQLNTYNDALNSISVQEKIDFLLNLEKYAFELDSRIISVSHCILGCGSSERIIRNSKGLNLKEKNNSIYAYISVVAKEKDVTKNGSAFIVGNNFQDFNFKSLAKEAVEEAISKLNSVDNSLFPNSILIKNKAFADILGAMAGIFSAENVQKGISQFKDKLGTKVAASNLTIVDNPHLENGYGSSSFDSEGVPTQSKEIIKNGILNIYLYNLKTAKKDHCKSTGNAAKGSYKGTMGTSPFNLYVEKGQLSFEEILRTLHSSILITSFSGLHSGLNSISGDFSLAAEGFIIQEGKIKQALNQITVAGNFFQLLNNIEAIGNDLKFNLSAVGSPSLLVTGLTISS